jgi:RecA/RadA recombinase
MSADDRKALIKLGQAAVRKSFKGSVSEIATKALEYPSVWASTGALSLDRLCSGGNPGGIPMGPSYGRIIHIAGEWSTAKAIWTEERVLTPRGFVKAGDVRAGDAFIGSDGHTTLVTGVFPQGERQLYRVAFLDGSAVIVDAEHLWSVRSANDISRRNLWRVLSTKDILSRGLRTEAGITWSIPTVKPVHFVPEGKLSIPAYILGVLLGDGALSAPAGIGWSGDDPGIARAISAFLPSTLEVRSHSDLDWSIVFKSRYRLKVHPYRAALKRMELHGKRSWEKFIPLEYLRASVINRLRLLQGLMDTDGTVDRRKGVSLLFASTSLDLANGVVDLVRSLGGVASIAYRELGTYKNAHGVLRPAREHWLVIFSGPFIPFLGSRKLAFVKPRVKRRLRKIASIEPAFMGSAVCFTVAARDQLFVMSSYVVTHNSLLLDHMFKSTIVDLKGLALCTETEGTRDPHFADAIKLPLDLLLIQRPKSFEEGFDMFEEWHTAIRKADEEIPILWGWDSLDSTEAEKSAGKGFSESGGWHFGGGRSEVLGAGLRRFAGICSRYPTSLVLLNQTRDNVGVMFGPKKRTPGGNPPHFYSTLEVMLRGAPRPDGGFVRSPVPETGLTKETIKRLGLYNMDKGAVLGRYIQAKVTKTKLAMTFDTTSEFYIDFRKGLHPWEGLAERLLFEGRLTTGPDFLTDFVMAGQKFADKKAWLTWLSDKLNKGEYEVVGLGVPPEAKEAKDNA